MFGEVGIGQLYGGGQSDEGWPSRSAAFADTFVESLRSYQGSDVFNPYDDRCPDHDGPDAPAVRRANLSTMLRLAIEEDDATLWIGRDPGYRGARRTGLPLTDEPHIEVMGRVFGTANLCRATRGQAMKERTATVVWNLLARIGRPVCLWNVFPFHPHEPDAPMTNRSHSRAEREAAFPYLESLIEAVRPTTIIAIGRDAEKAVAELGLCDRSHGVRHPSYGGQKAFTAQVEALYGLDAQGAAQGELI